MFFFVEDFLKDFGKENVHLHAANRIEIKSYKNLYLSNKSTPWALLELYFPFRFPRFRFTAFRFTAFFFGDFFDFRFDSFFLLTFFFFRFLLDFFLINHCLKKT